MAADGFPFTLPYTYVPAVTPFASFSVCVCVRACEPQGTAAQAEAGHVESPSQQTDRMETVYSTS